ncbi:M28 family peptidase [Candidatus Nitrospira nitrificans]|uniref:Putative Peptidase, M28 family n=1 Tax=Candidatus Nitrospira nitrificans TaxID=1742973 RepID=A0A0S4LVG9_9BACT|nr:M28 family peptidase [Candidatus Nitrospira nitrificans]CUS39947.1 putative Peptidase, M28 family [Candidatus Nitrospira nitrificans]
MTKRSPSKRVRPSTQIWRSWILFCTALALTLQPPPSLAQLSKTSLEAAIESLSADRMLADIRTLSGPVFNGRQSGTADDLRSAQWVAQEFLAAGLRLPLVGNNSLVVPFFTGKNGASSGAMATSIFTSLMAPEPTLRVGSTDHLTVKTLGSDYFPVFDSPSADIQGQIVFVGYGIVDPTHGIDDYAGVDVSNCIVLFLRGKPEHYPRPVTHADKVRFARNRGALGYLTATGPLLHPYEIRRGVTGSPSAFYGQLPPDQAIPGAWINTALAQELLTESNGTAPDRLRTLQEHLNQAASSQATRTDRYASLHWETATKEGLLVNVLGMIPGTGTEAVIIGAHRDHFGRPGGLLFPGADDNASGTAVIVEVARALAKLESRPSRTILFISFSGEERDLLGSRLYTSRPIIPLDTTRAMINIDHAGVGNGRLTVGVTGLEKEVALAAGKAAGIHDKLDLYGFFPGGDHVPFKEAAVPTVTVVSGGVHPHFHQPTDTADTIEPGLVTATARYVLAMTWQLAYGP